MIIIHTNYYGKETIFAFIIKRRRVYNQFLGVENSFSNEPYLKALSLPTNNLLVLDKFG